MRIPDREIAIKILNNRYPESKFAGPEEAIEAWKIFVDNIVNGKYDGNENEYWNDLDIRWIIEKIGYGHSVEIKQIDEKFKTTLIHTNVRNWGNDEECKDDWWNFGYPKTLTGYLKDYFKTN